MKAYIKVTLEDRKIGYVAADDIGTVYEAEIHPRPGKGEATQKPTPMLVLLLSSGNKLHIRGETLESLFNKMEQALGVPKITVVEHAIYDQQAA